MRPLVLIAAVAANGVIGRDNRLLWRLKTDMQHFKALTLGKPLIMGRKTFISIGRPLPGRTTIVVTRDKGFQPAGVRLADSLDAAVQAAEREADRLQAEEIIVAGGGEIYAAFLPLAARLEITEVALSPPGDVVFPRIDPLIWQETRREHHQQSAVDEADFSFVTYRRAHLRDELQR